MADHYIYVQMDPPPTPGHPTPQGLAALLITDENEQGGNPQSATAPGATVTDKGAGVRKRMGHGKTVSWCVPNGNLAQMTFGSGTPFPENSMTTSAASGPWMCTTAETAQGSAADRYKYSISYTSSDGKQLSEDPQIIIDDSNPLTGFTAMLEQNGLPIAIVALLVVIGLVAYIFSLRRRLAAH